MALDAYKLLVYLGGMETLSTTAQVIDALGGNTEMGKRCGFKHQRVCNWRGWDHFPTDTYAIIQGELAKVGMVASPMLWRSIPSSVFPGVAIALSARAA